MLAVTHKLPIAIWHVLSDHVPYREPGAHYFTKRNPEPTNPRMIKQANSPGPTTRFNPTEAT